METRMEDEVEGTLHEYVYIYTHRVVQNEE